MKSNAFHLQRKPGFLVRYPNGTVHPTKIILTGVWKEPIVTNCTYFFDHFGRKILLYNVGLIAICAKKAGLKKMKSHSTGLSFAEKNQSFQLDIQMVRFIPLLKAFLLESGRNRLLPIVHDFSTTLVVI